MEQAQLLWQPSRDRVEASHMFSFIRRIAQRYGIEPDYPSLHRWSISHSDDFWREMLELGAIEAINPASTAPSGTNALSTRTGTDMLSTRWFPEMQLNFAAHLLRFDDDRIAIAAEDERGRSRSYTYHELRGLVARCASGMRAAGVRNGDRVAGFMPNIPEAVIAMLAAASIGAIWSSCSPDFGINGVHDRFGQIGPKLLVTADGYSYNGKRIDSLDRIGGVIRRIDSIKTVVVVPFLDDAPDLAGLAGREKARLWDDFLGDRDAELTFEPTPFDHPLYIMYSSGTTGVPKCIVHGAGGTLIQHMKELMLHCDLHRDDKIFYFTTCGWMMWNWLVSGLGVGATIVLYEGAPFHPQPNHLWRMAQDIGITVFGTSPKYIGACDKEGLQPGTEFDLSKLRAVLSTGSPLTVEHFHWVYDNVKRDLQLSSISGGTDIISCFMLGNPILPVYAGEIQCVGLGMDVRAYDAHGQSVIGETGELVCCAPFPSQPTCFWNDSDGAKYRGAYFEHYPGVWRHGDFVTITERGGVIISGRSDATLNPGGVRIGTAEIYRQVDSMAEVVDSVVVGRKTPDGDVDVVLFVVLPEGASLDAELAAAIRRQIRQNTTPRHVPKHIHQVSAVPYTISGKKVELAVTRTIHGEKVTNRDALANPESLEEYKRFS